MKKVVKNLVNQEKKKQIAKQRRIKVTAEIHRTVNEEEEEEEEEEEFVTAPSSPKM